MAGSFSGTLDTAAALPRLSRAELNEHSLLGSLIHAPDPINGIATFLEWRDFSSPDLRSVYLTVQGLARAGDLVAVSPITDRATQMRACAENKRRVYEALSDLRFVAKPLLDAPSTFARLTEAAPPETVPYRGVYDPSAQMRMARDVLAESVRRKVTGAGVLMQRRAPLVRPVATAGRRELAALSLRSNLETVQANLDRMTERWYRAVDRVGTNVGMQTATSVAAAAGAQQRPTRPGPITAIRLRRAEQHLIHLAVHTGRHLDGSIQPGHFSDPARRNTWRLLMEIRGRGEPVNHVSLFNEKYRDPLSGPVMSDQDIVAMRTAPTTRPSRIAGSLRTVVQAALTRATKDTAAAVTSAATNRAVPIEGLLDYADHRLQGLKGRATTAHETHKKITEQQKLGWSPTR